MLANRMTPTRVLITLTVGLLCSGCNGPASLPLTATPTAVPGPQAAPVVQGPFPLIGLVFEQTPNGPAPLADVQLYCDSCGEVGVGHTFTQTDANGMYRFLAVLSGNNGIQIKARNGYRAVTGGSSGGWTLHNVFVSANGDTRFDIELTRQ